MTDLNGREFQGWFCKGGKQDLPWTSWGAAKGAAKADEMRRRTVAEKRVAARIVAD